MPNRRRPTLRNVAAWAGVSPAAASLILNDVPGTRLAAATRARVLAAAEQLGYRPNAMARSLRTARSQTIGLVTDAIAGRAGAAAVIAGAQARAWQDDCVLMLANSDGDTDTETALIEWLLSHQVAGIVYVAGPAPRAMAPRLLSSMSAVLVGCTVADRALPSVAPDDAAGAFMATQALIDAGHWRIACLAPTAENAAAIDRRDGFAKALESADLEADRELVCAGDYEETLRFMALRQPPTAIVCLSDTVALGCYDALKHLRLRIPDDVAVVGFDDGGMAAALRPPLSAIVPPHTDMGRWAVDYLLRAGSGGDLTVAPQVKLAGRLERRRSF